MSSVFQITAVAFSTSFHGTDVLAVSEHGAPGRRPNIHTHFVGRQREDGLDTLPARRQRRAVHTDRGPTRRPPLPPTSAAGAAACSAGRRLPASPRSRLTPRPTRCSSSPQAVSPSVRALTRPRFVGRTEGYTAVTRLHAF